MVLTLTNFQLRKYTGKDDNHICIGVKGEIYDVTRGSNFYGPDGPYGAFAGRDASRAFACFSTDESMFKESYCFIEIQIIRTRHSRIETQFSLSS